MSQDVYSISLKRKRIRQQVSEVLEIFIQGKEIEIAVCETPEAEEDETAI